MAPALITSILSSARSTLSTRAVPHNNDISTLGPLAARSALLGRDDDSAPVVRVGVDPHQINNNAIFALFGLIGVAIVLGGIWFFFWAKNGGFYFREDDWDDYKSTVLRRRGPNGTLLSGATESTKLGGGSVYKDVDDGSTEATPTVLTDYTDSTAMSGITAGVSNIGGREKRRKKQEQREREKERRREEKSREKEEYRRRKASKTKRKVGEDGLLIDEEAEAAAKEQLRHYRHEKPARVGGLNKESEASEWDGSTNPSHSTASQSQASYPAQPESVYTYDTGSTVTAELLGNRERTPTSTPTKTANKVGIRKVYSTADKTANRENERYREEARRLREKEKEKEKAGPSSRHSRRDFSWKPADDGSAVSSTTPLRAIEEVSAVSSEAERTERRERRARQAARSKSRHAKEGEADTESRVPGSWAQSDVSGSTESDLGTKVYRHSVHIPIPSSANSSTAASDFAYAEEKRKRRGGAGYRRDRGRDELSEVGER